MNKIWKIKASQPELSRCLASSLKISPVIAQLLINRGIKDEMQAQHFLYADISSCHNGHLLKDMDKAVQRIKSAIDKKEKILLYGDYDVDGITSVALLKLTLDHFRADTETYIPNRLEEGYGLNETAIKLAKDKKITLLITTDCGISGHKEVDSARRAGIDVIITDHHEIKSKDLPKAFAIINPLQNDCGYPFKYLSGVGIAYKLAKVLTEGTDYPVEDHLDLVALGTVSDLSAQQGENRILTKEGLKKLTSTKKIGIRALIEVAGLKGKDISCGHIGYILGPRINAMGRIGSPDVALQLLITGDEHKAAHLAAMLNRENRNRQKIEREIQASAMEKIEREVNFKETRVIVLSAEAWHSGVIGIVASRIVDKFYRPAIVISVDGDVGKGSARSIDGFHLFEAINSCGELLLDFGGHEGACGISIEKKNINAFTRKINKIAEKMLTDEHLYPSIDIDAEIGISDINDKFLAELDLLVPFGPENPKPLFVSKDIYLKNDPRRIARNGFKLWITDDKTTCEAISFKSDGFTMPEQGARVQLVYSPSINTWQGISSLQLDLKDLRITE